MPRKTDIKAKYNSEAAKAFRDKVSAEAEGKAWTAPENVTRGPWQGGGGGNGAAMGVGAQRGGGGGGRGNRVGGKCGGNDWNGNWGDEGRREQARPGQEYTRSDYAGSSRRKRTPSSRVNRRSTRVNPRVCIRAKVVSTSDSVRAVDVRRDKRMSSKP